MMISSMTEKEHEALRHAIANSGTYRHILWEIDVNEKLFGGTIEFIKASLQSWARDIRVDLPGYGVREIKEEIRPMLLGPWEAIGEAT